MARGLVVLGLCLLAAVAVIGCTTVRANDDLPRVVVTSAVSPIEVAPGVTLEWITSTPALPESAVPVTVGLQRITLAPVAVFDLVAILGYGYQGPVQFYVESGVMTLDSWSGKVLIGHDDHGVTSGGAALPEIRQGEAVYVEDGRIGPIQNLTDKPLLILAILVVPQPEGGLESEDSTALPGS